MYPLESLLRELEEHDKKGDDVRWVGTRDGKLALDWDTFIERFEAFLFSQPLDPQDEPIYDVVVVGDGWWIRRDHDSEWGHSYWWYYEIPKRANDARPFRFAEHEGEFGIVDENAPPPVHADHPCHCGETRVVPDGDHAGMCWSCGAPADQR